MINCTNPILCMDYPDPDILRVGDTYYMISTTMYFMPGGVLLRSFDLANWEIASYVYDTLDDTPSQCLSGGQDIYGKGMWAPTLRYHKGTFYVLFVANDTHRTYLYRSKSPEGPWIKQYVEGFYHDASLLFDDDDRTYIVYGNTKIYLTELNSDLTAPKKGGLHRLLVEDTGDVGLGYEGSHIYKIRGRYYLFLIHWPNSAPNRRTQAVFVSDSLTGTFTGKDVMNDDLGYRNAGSAQGGIVDTPEGDYYAVLFRDMGAVGRIPVLVPVRFEKNFPVFGVNGLVPRSLELKSTRPDYVYEPLYADDDFCYTPDSNGNIALKKVWEWNHNPVPALWSVTKRPGFLCIQTGKISCNPLYCQNTLTQRTYWPGCEAQVTIDAVFLQDGDCAGLVLLQSCYGSIGIKREHGGFFLVMEEVEGPFPPKYAGSPALWEGEEAERIPLAAPSVRVRAVCNFYQNDTVTFFYEEHGSWKRFGPVHKLYFLLDHFTGARFGLFVYSKNSTGGIGCFGSFLYRICPQDKKNL